MALAGRRGAEPESVRMKLITTTDELKAAVDRVSQGKFVTVDTEFMRESTYWPKLCLLQFAGSD